MKTQLGRHSRASSVSLAFSLLEKYNFSSIPSTPCHGDLTLENILIDNAGNIYLIDFLDSFANSWYVDAAKILQDLEVGWSWRDERSNMNLEIRRAIALKYFKSYLIRYEALTPVYYVLLLNLLRILPYAKDEKTSNFLYNSLLKVAQQLNVGRQSNIPLNDKI